MALTDDLGLDPERLERRISFLKQRAEVHLGKRDGHAAFEIACAATLRRDAAALELLLGKALRARELLSLAGSSFVQIGLFVGFTLMSLAAPDSWRDQYHAELVALLDALRETVRPVETSGASDTDRDHRGLEKWKLGPLTSASLGSTRQLLHLRLAFGSRQHDDEIANTFVDILDKRLLQTPATPIGSTGLPLQSYMKMIATSRDDVSSDGAFESLVAAASLRAEQIEAARADSYHWRLALAPSDLVDFDLLAIAAARWDARQTLDDISGPFRRPGGGVDAPLRAAIDLRSAQPRPGVAPSA